MRIDSQKMGFIERLTIALAHRWEPERIFVILTAYLDESGTHDGSPVTIMGGILATATKWSRFEVEFRKIKKRHGFKVFHTKKFKKKSGDFFGWSDERCMALLQDLAFLTNDAFAEAVTMTVDNEDYAKEYRTGGEPARLRLDTKYGLAFRQCLWFFILEAEKRKHKGKFPKLNFVLENGHANAGDALRIFRETKEELKKIDFDVLGDLIFSEKDDSDPLMMADFIAHTTFMLALKGRNESANLTGEHEPIQRGQSAVTHLQFQPGGLTAAKDELMRKLKKPRSTSEVLPAPAKRSF